MFRMEIRAGQPMGADTGCRSAEAAGTANVTLGPAAGGNALLTVARGACTCTGSDPAPGALARGVGSRPQYYERCIRVFQIALELGNSGDDLELPSLQDEVRRDLPMAPFVDRAVTAVGPMVKDQPLTDGDSFGLGSDTPCFQKPDRSR